MLSPEELMAGSSLTYEVEVPPEVLQPASATGTNATARPRTVRLRPLTVSDLQLVSRAAKENDTLVGLLRVQRALVEPAMSVAQVAALHAGLVEYLAQQVNQVSGLNATGSQVSSALEAPLVKAALVLAREYGWTPQQVNELTLGQVLLHLGLLSEAGAA
jgi:hypothetical protein